MAPIHTDIPAYPCGFAEHATNFATPFAMAGLSFLSIAAAALTATVLVLAWCLAALVWLLRARR